MKLGLILLVTTVLFSPLAAAGGDVVAGKAKATSCAACHGVDGNSASAGFPSLAGQHEDYLAKQLADFKSGARENAIMSGQVMALSDQDIADVAAYYASQRAQGNVAADENLELGEAIFRGGIADAKIAACIGCHAANGSGTPGAGFPRLAGQHRDYTIAQLNAFRSGARANDSNSMMREIAKRMRDSEIEAVANYIQGLQ